MGKYISCGMGSSKNKDSYKAGIEAAKESLKNTGKEATFSIVYTNSKANQEKIAKGINEVLGTNWVGLSTDRQFSSLTGYDKEIQVSILTLNSKYLHFGVGVSDNHRKNPKQGAAKATKEAMSNAKGDEYIDSYMQFTRTKKQTYQSIVKTPPYFMLTFFSGVKVEKDKAISGQEMELLEGVLEVAGPHIPVFGGGAGSDFEDFLYKNKGTNYQFANGKVYKDAAVIVFVVSNLYFENDVRHGYIMTDKFAPVTKLDKKGFEVLKINGKEAVEEYCRLVGIKKGEYLKDPFKYSLTHPFGLVALDGKAYIKEALPNPDGKSFHSTYRLKENTAMNILKYDEKKHTTTVSDIIKDSKKGKEAVALFCNCSTRRLLYKNDGKKLMEILSKKTKIPFFGMYNFSEIGSTKTSSAQVHGETVTSLIIYDQLLVEKN